MATIFKLPDLGEGIHEAEIVSIKVKEGDTVKEGDIILEVETDKAIVEIPSPVSGKISAIHVGIGDRLNVGEQLITFDQGVVENTEERARAEPVKKDRPVDSEEIHEDSLKRQGKTSSGNKVIPASPATRRLARELGVDLSLVTPTGSEGLVTAGDVKMFALHQDKESERVPQDTMELKTVTVTPAHRKIDAPPLPNFSKWGPVRRDKINAVRRIISRQMTLSWSQIPHVNSQDFADITELDTVRNDYKSKIEQKGAKLTLSAFVLKTVATALKRYPRFNASLDLESEEMIFKEYYHIGVAVDTPDGLIVPVVKDVDRKSIADIAIELTDLVERTRNRKAKLDEMQGSTFTITNAGSLGGGYFAPIINYPEVAILGLGRATWQPVVRETTPNNKEVVVRFMLPLILSIDHRVLDGADAIKFLLMIKSALEDPQELMMTMI